MSMVKPFVVSVAASGLPKGFMMSPTRYERLRGLEPSELTRLYWTLEAVTFEYALVSNGERIERSVQLTSNKKPLDRLDYGAKFIVEEQYPSLHGPRATYGLLNLSFPKEDPGGKTYAVHFEFVDETVDGESILTIVPERPVDLRVLDSATFEFLGRTFTVELTAMFPEQTGSIEYISVTPHYYTFEPESFAEKLKALWGRYFGPDASGRFEDFVDAVDALIEERDAACEDGICQYREEGERWFVCSDEFVNEDTGLRWKLVENKCVSRGVDVDARGETSVRYDADNDDVVIVHRNAEQQWALSVSADALRDLEKEDTDGLHRLAEGITIPDAFNGVDWDDIVFEFPKDVQASGFEKSEPELKRVVTSFVADFLPFVGTGKSLYELVAGVDPITGEEVGRVWAAVGLGGSFIPGGKGVVRAVKRVFGRLIGVTDSESLLKLNRKLSALQKAQKEAKSYKTLPDGRIRYYFSEVLATRPGKIRGASRVLEYDPGTQNVRMWMESYDHSGNVMRVRPKMINGEILDLPHYPPTQKDLMKGEL